MRAPEARLRRLAWRALVCLLACGMALAAGAIPVRAEQPGEFVTKARNAILMDYDTGSILYQKGADELVPPASLSKLMTLAVLFKALKEGKVRLEDEFIMSENAWRKGGAPSGTSAMYVEIKTKATINELMQGIIVQSGNDACISVAEGLAGTEAAFAKEMEEEARRIGLKRSTFKNATGLPADGHLMSARELAALARHLIREYPDHYRVFGQKEFEFINKKNKKFRFFNRNPLLGSELGVDGLKTGHTAEAGYGLVVSAVNEGRRTIGVVMGLADEKERREEARRIIEWGIKSFATFKLFEADEPVGYARVWGGSRYYVPLSGKEAGPLEVVLPRFPASQKLRGEILYLGPLKPPIAKGDKVATLRVTSSVSGGSEPTAMSEVPLYAASEVEPANFLWKGLDSLVFLALRLVRL